MHSRSRERESDRLTRPEGPSSPPSPQAQGAYQQLPFWVMVPRKNREEKAGVQFRFISSFNIGITWEALATTDAWSHLLEILIELAWGAAWALRFFKSSPWDSKEEPRLRIPALCPLTLKPNPHLPPPPTLALVSGASCHSADTQKQTTRGVVIPFYR